MILCFLLAALSGASRAVTEALHTGWAQTRFRRFPASFWDPAVSWKRKWAGGQPERGPAFFLSTTVLVAFTDAWHAFGLLTLLTVGLSAHIAPTTSAAFGALLIHSITFEGAFRFFRLRQQPLRLFPRSQSINWTQKGLTWEAHIEGRRMWFTPHQWGVDQITLGSSRKSVDNGQEYGDLFDVEEMKAHCEMWAQNHTSWPPLTLLYQTK